MTKDQGDAAELGIDPFAKLVSITSVRSVGDLVRASSDQASAEKAEMMGGNGSAVSRSSASPVSRASKIVIISHLVDETRSCPLSGCKQILEARSRPAAHPANLVPG